MEGRIEEIKSHYERIIDDLQKKVELNSAAQSKSDSKIKVQNDILKKEIEEKNIELDVWRAKYVKLKQEITELKAQFKEYEKIMTNFK